MGKDFTKQGSGHGYLIYLKGFLIELAVTAVFVAVFALVMYLFESGYKYAAVFGTVSVAAGAFFAALYASRKIGSRGWLTGFIIGGITFLVITLISLIAEQGGLTFNTLFHFIILMLSSVVGGVVGVNRHNSRKYI